jgi:hypothetical protein
VTTSRKRYVGRIAAVAVAGAALAGTAAPAYATSSAPGPVAAPSAAGPACPAKKPATGRWFDTEFEADGTPVDYYLVPHLLGFTIVAVVCD